MDAFFLKENPFFSEFSLTSFPPKKKKKSIWRNNPRRSRTFCLSFPRNSPQPGVETRHCSRTALGRLPLPAPRSPPDPHRPAPPRRPSARLRLPGSATAALPHGGKAAASRAPGRRRGGLQAEDLQVAALPRGLPPDSAGEPRSPPPAPPPSPAETPPTHTHPPPSSPAHRRGRRGEARRQPPAAHARRQRGAGSSVSASAFSRAGRWHRRRCRGTSPPADRPRRCQSGETTPPAAPAGRRAATAPPGRNGTARHGTAPPRRAAGRPAGGGGGSPRGAALSADTRGTAGLPPSPPQTRPPHGPGPHSAPRAGQRGPGSGHCPGGVPSPSCSAHGCGADPTPPRSGLC